MKLILASNNAHKLEEYRQLVSDLDIELISQREAGCDFEAEENGTSFKENAFIKANAVTLHTGLPAIADDSGLVVDALNGEPGIYSARYGSGFCTSDEDRYNYLLSRLGDNPNRSARFVCCICCTFPNGDRVEARGECEGSILFSPAGEHGFGYDPVFSPLNSGKSMAEHLPEEKNAISHRGKALREFVKVYKEYADGNNK